MNPATSPSHDGPRWRAYLAGEPGELEGWERCFQRGPLRIEREGQSFVLRSDTFQATDDARAVRDKAEEALLLMKGIAAGTSLADWEPPRLRGVAFRDHEGKLHHYMFAEGIHLRLRAGIPRLEVSGPNGPVDPSPTKWERRASAAARDAHLAEAMRLFAHDQSWVTLCKVIELAEHFAPRGHLDKWVSKAQRDRITGSAQLPATAGRDSRHAVRPHGPPRNSIPLEAAQILITQLLDGWAELVWEPSEASTRRDS